MKKYSSVFAIYSCLVFLLLILLALCFIIYTCNVHNQIRYNDFVVIFLFTIVLIGISLKYIELLKYDYNTLFLSEKELILKGEKGIINISIENIDKIEFDSIYFMRGAHLGIVKILTNTKNQYTACILNTSLLKKELDKLLKQGE